MENVINIKVQLEENGEHYIEINPSDLNNTVLYFDINELYPFFRDIWLNGKDDYEPDEWDNDKIIVKLTENNRFGDIFSFYSVNDQNGRRDEIFYQSDFILKPLLPSLIIDLNDPIRGLEGNTKTTPLHLGIQGDKNSYNIALAFDNASKVQNCKCFVQYINANLEGGNQEITRDDCPQINNKNEIELKDNEKYLIVNWKPNYGLMKKNGLVTFAFQFFKIATIETGVDNTTKEEAIDNIYELDNPNKHPSGSTQTSTNTTTSTEEIYTFILNTSQLYGFVHESVLVDEEVIVDKYPSEIADLYQKYNQLMNDGDIADLDSIEDIRSYLYNRVPTNIGNTMTEDDIKNLPDNIQFLVAYNPKTNQYSYTPAIKLNDQVIIGNIWNAE